jgi:uncharacterized protein YcnI
MNGSAPAPRTRRRRGLRYGLTVALASLAAVVLLASPAAAHTEISLDNATAGATNVTMSVTAEAENSKAGVAKVAVQLPAGLTPDEISLVKGPAGWALAPTADGYQISGPALQQGVDVAYQIKISKLPATPGVLTFKTVVTYANGEVDSWIGAPDAANPAPTVSLAPGSAPASAPATASPTTPAAQIVAPVATPAAKSSGWPSWATWLIVLVVLAVLVAGALLLGRRRRNQA